MGERERNKISRINISETKRKCYRNNQRICYVYQIQKTEVKDMAKSKLVQVNEILRQKEREEKSALRKAGLES